MRRRRARLVAAIGLAAFGIASFAAASSLGDHHPVAGPRQAGAFPLGSAPSSTGDVRTHGIAQPHRVPAIRTMSPGRPRWYGNKTVDELRGSGDAEGLPQALPAPSKDGALQSRTGGRAIPAPIVSFNGVGNRNGLLPPDTNGEIGPNHYLQIANVSFAVYNRDGSIAYGPANNNLLFTGTPLCGTHNQGDPLVLYDQFSERWMASQFATGPDGNYECISVSATNDPTGAWCGYEFLIHPTKFGDYPKFGVWPTQNAFVMTVNQFAGTDWGGVGVYGFERDRMLACEPARFVYEDMYDVNPNLGSFLPADPDGSIAPPDGAPIPFVTVRDGAPDALSIWSGAIDWSTPSLSVTHDRDLTVASFSSNLCGGSWNCIPQPGTTVGLEPLSDRLMQRLAYRNFGGWQTMVVDHTVNAGSNRAGVRWYELADQGAGGGSASRERSRRRMACIAGWEASRRTRAATSRSATRSPARRPTRASATRAGSRQTRPGSCRKARSRSSPAQARSSVIRAAGATTPRCPSTRTTTARSGTRRSTTPRRATRTGAPG